MDKKKEVKTTKKVTKVTKNEKTTKKLDYKKVVTNEKFLLGVFILLAICIKLSNLKAAVININVSFIILL